MPVANEESSIGEVLDEITNLPYDNLYVYPIMDNYSKDRTEEIIRKKEQENNHVKLVYYPQSKGVVSCYLHGFKVALEDGAERIIEMDGGGSHLPCEIPQFISKLDEGFDCVWGSRFIDGGDICNHPLYRRILSSGGTILANIVLGTKLKDMTSGFEAFQRNILEGLDLDSFLSRGHIYQTEMRFYCRNYRTIEVPIHYVGSESSLKMKSVREALHVLFKLKKNEYSVMKGNTK